MHTTLTTKGQMTLPAVGRTRLGLEAGDQLLVTVLDDDTVQLTRKPARSIDSLLGFLPKPAKAVSLDQMDEGVTAHLQMKAEPHRLGE